MTPVENTLRKALTYGAGASAAIAIVGGVIGLLVAGAPGLVSALLGSGVGFLFVGVTALSISLAARLTRDDPGNPIFFAVIMGAWLVKFVAFLVLVLVLREQSFVQPTVLFWCLIASAVGSVTGDVVAVLRSRVPYVVVPATSDSAADSPSTNG